MSNTTRRWLAAAVLSHLAVSLVHGTAHSGAEVPLSPTASFFVFFIILAGPLIGLGLMWFAPTLGASIVAVTMIASLVFGVVNHFVRSSPDHVAHVAPAWQPLFAVTAVLLALTEALGSGVAIRILRTEAMS